MVVPARLHSADPPPARRLSTAPVLLPAPPLPVPLTPLVGRSAEVAAIRDLVRDESVRLVSLVGPVGVGKSRLAIAVAHGLRAQDAFSDGIRLVRLAALGDPRLVLETVARALGVPVAAGSTPLETLQTALRDRELVLVLDNFEDVIDAGPDVADLLRACPGVTALVTSRQRLRVRGERLVRVAPLPIPGAEDRGARDVSTNPAVDLFVQRGQDADAGFGVTEENAATIAAIVRRLDGLPLAIELAAARLDVLSPERLLARLERPLAELVDGAHDLPDRLRTMRAAIAWSCDLLSPAEQRVFRALGVFPASFSPAGAAAVCAVDADTVLASLSSLLGKSLLARDPQADDRFTMLGVVREFARESLAAGGEAEDRWLRLTTWCTGLAEEGAAARAHGRVHAELLDRVEREHDAVRAALGWLEAAADAARLVRLAGALAWFWLFRSYRAEGRYWLGRALALARNAGLRTADVCRVLHGAVVLTYPLGDYEQAAALANDYLGLSTELGDVAAIAAAENLLGVIARARGSLDEAVAHQERALALYRGLGDSGWAALVLVNLGAVALLRGEAARAEALLTEALETYRQLQDRFGMAVTLSDLGLVARTGGDRIRARALLAESLEHWRALGTREGLLDWLARVGALAADDGGLQLAARLLAAADAAQREIGYVFEPAERERIGQALVQARRGLGDARFDAAWAGGSQLGLDDALAEAAHFLALPAPEPAGRGDAAANVAGLTPRELDVLRLVAAGYSDRQIGEALFISHRTVMRHVEHILAKLDVESRTAAATQAVRLGIV
jgi:predicted ATPase/DNA-binding CsgD family transcriptional regulator